MNCDKVFDLYKDMLNLHIGTKTNDIVFHQASASFYETLFAAFHDAKEALQDSKQESAINAKEARAKSYKLLMEAKSILESMVNENKDIAVDNVLRGLVDKLWFECGTARGFCECGDSDSASEKESNQEPSKKEESEPEKKTEEPESKDDVSSYGMEVEVVVEDNDEDEEDNKEEDEKKKELVDGWIPNQRMVSRIHAKIVRVDNRFFIIDEESLNVTYLNGKKLTKKYIKRNWQEIITGI